MGAVLEGADEPLLDADTFEETISVMGSSEAASLVTEFEETMRANLAALQTAINAHNMDQSCKVAHRALSFCLVTGAVSLTGRLRRIEEAAGAGDAGITRGLATGIDPILMSSLSEMRSALERPASQGSEQADVHARITKPNGVFLRPRQ
jgi:HPt (histidine-containing phosphotransfer) domain-containing protein